MTSIVDERALRRDIARQLAAEAFGRPRRQRHAWKLDDESRLRWARAERSARLAADLRSDEVREKIPHRSCLFVC